MAQVLLDLDDGSKTLLIKIEVLFSICFLNILPSHMVEDAEPPQPHFGPPDPCIRVMSNSRRLKPDQVYFWKVHHNVCFITFV